MSFFTLATVLALAIFTKVAHASPAAADANAVAQEKGVEMVVTFVKFAGENAAKTRDAVVPALVDKCFGSTRAGTKVQASELVLQYVEVENGAAAIVVRG